MRNNNRICGRFVVSLAATAAASAMVTTALAGSINFGGRTWTTYDVDPSSDPTYSVVNDHGVIKGTYGPDAAMVTPFTLHVGDRASYDYTLTNPGSNNWVGSSFGDFRGGTFSDVDNMVGYLITGRVGYTQDFQTPRNLHFADAGFNLAGSFPGTGETGAGLRIEWTFPDAHTYAISVRSLSAGGPVATFSGSTGGNAITDVTFFRQDMNDTLQTATVGNFLQRAAAPAPSGNTFNWNTASGAYPTGANWNPASAPTLADNIVIANGGVATVSTTAGAAAVNVGQGSGNGTLNVLPNAIFSATDIIRIGAGTSTGTISQSGGHVMVDYGANDDLRIGFDAGGTGVYNLSNGELEVGDSMTIGHFGSGRFNMTGGFVSKAGFITIGNNPGSAGTFTMSAGVVTQSFGDLEIGDEATGVFQISGGTFNVAPGRFLSLGNRRGGSGTATISGTAVVNAPEVTVGGNLDAVQNGTATIQGIGVLNINGGELNDDDDLLVGHLGKGTVNMTAGLISHSGWIVLGDEVGSAGTFNMSGGTINQSFGELQIGDAATGRYNQSGGTVNISGAVLVANQPGSNGVATISGGVLNTPATVVNSNGTIHFSGGSFNAGSLAVNDGQVLLTTGHNKVLNTTHVSVSGAGKIDLADNNMVIDYNGSVGSLVGDTRQMISSNQITSSSADATHRLGYADNAVLGKTTFAGESVDSSSILIKFTYGGDANLDGQVDVTDLGALATAWQTSAPWTGGDFNYDGFVDVSDLGILATDWQLGVGSPLGRGSLEAALASVGLGGVSVPEPTIMGALGICLAAVASRRRTRRS
jgi:hypothetical protein